MMTTSTIASSQHIVVTAPTSTEPISSVVIAAFNELGVMVAKTSMTRAEWLRHFHPLIDSAKQRRALGVGMIIADLSNHSGRRGCKWTMTFAPDGSLLEAFETREQMPSTQGEIDDAMIERLRWIVPLHNLRLE